MARGFQEADEDLLDYVERKAVFLKGVHTLREETTAKMKELEGAWGEKLLQANIRTAVDVLLDEMQARMRVKEVTHVQYLGPYTPNVKVPHADRRLPLDLAKRRKWISSFVFLYPGQNKVLVSYTKVPKSSKKRSTQVSWALIAGEKKPKLVRSFAKEQRKVGQHLVELQGLDLIKGGSSPGAKAALKKSLTFAFLTEEELDTFCKDAQFLVESVSQEPRTLENLTVEEFNEMRKSIDMRKLYERIKQKSDAITDLNEVVAEEVLVCLDAKLREET